MRYFIGNWKMFGVPKSISILSKINSFQSKDKNRNKVYSNICLTARPQRTLDELSFIRHQTYCPFFEREKVRQFLELCKEHRACM